MVAPILDNVDKIFAVDKSGMIDYAIDASKHYRKAVNVASQIQVDFPKPENIVIAGMGGSAIGGDLLKDWAKDRLKITVEVNREYHLPKYVGKKSLVIVASYSGDTEESLSSFLEALKRKCMIFCISSGGALIKYAKKLNVPYLQVPGGMPPRAGLPYMFVPLVVLMEKIGLVKNVNEELDEAVILIKKVSQENGPSVLTRDNFAKTVANHIGETAPTVYGFGFYRSVALRMKQQFNENSKSAAKWEYFPELDHNEIVGWEGRGEQCKYFSVIFIHDPDAPVEITSRVETTQQIMERTGLIMFDLKVQGKSTLAKMLSTIVVGDFISVYLAVIRGVDPTPVKTISYLKNSIQKNNFREEVIDALEKM